MLFFFPQIWLLEGKAVHGRGELWQNHQWMHQGNRFGGPIHGRVPAAARHLLPADWKCHCGPARSGPCDQHAPCQCEGRDHSLTRLELIIAPNITWTPPSPPWFYVHFAAKSQCFDQAWKHVHAAAAAHALYTRFQHGRRDWPRQPRCFSPQGSGTDQTGFLMLFWSHKRKGSGNLSLFIPPPPSPHPNPCSWKFCWIRWTRLLETLMNAFGWGPTLR